MPRTTVGSFDQRKDHRKICYLFFLSSLGEILIETAVLHFHLIIEFKNKVHLVFYLSRTEATAVITGVLMNLNMEGY